MFIKDVKPMEIKLFRCMQVVETLDVDHIFLYKLAAAHFRRRHRGFCYHSDHMAVRD